MVVYPTIEVDENEADIELVRLGLLSEEERINRGYQRIFARHMKRGLFGGSRTNER